MSLLSRLVNVVRSDRLTRDIDEELTSHLEEAAAQGRNGADARRALGPSLRLREESRDARLIPWLDSLRADFVFGWRQLNKRKTTSLAAILSLGLAIGASTAAFRIIDALLFRPLPISHPERLYAFAFQGVDVDGKSQVQDALNYPLYRQMRDAVADRADLLAISYPGGWGVTYGSEQDLERATGQQVSGRMFADFGLRPALGRLLTEDDDAVPGRAYAVLSFDYWTRRFGRDPKVIGRTFRNGRGLYTIVGVGPKGFTGVEPGTLIDIFIPAMMNSNVGNPHVNWMHAVAVLKPGFAAEPVRERLQAIGRAFFSEMVKEVPTMPKEIKDAIVNARTLLEPAAAGVSNMQRTYREALICLAVLVALVLLIAGANVANLMTAQAASRAREMALRISIGAGRARLIQLVLVESAMLAAFAAAIGGLFAMWAAPFVVARINPPDNPARLLLPADWRVIGFLLAMTFGITVLLGLAPALRAAKAQPFDALRGGASRRSYAMHSLVAVQAAFCLLVLFVAGLFVSTFERLTNQPLGFSAERVLAVDVVARNPQPPAFWDQLLDSLRATPGVESVARTEWPLLTGGGWNNFVAPNGGPTRREPVDFMSVSPGWLETMKIPLLTGRDLRSGEVFPGEAAVVNQAFADQFFKGENPLGKFFTIRVGIDDAVVQRVTIVGLAANTRYASMREEMPPAAYVGVRSELIPDATCMVRTVSKNSLGLVPTLRQAIANTAPGLRLSSVNTQEDVDRAQTVRERLLAMLAGFFAVVALLLAGVGLYGVLDYSVFQRRREIGIRMAVGARAWHIVRGVTLGIAAQMLVGAAGGLGVGIASARYIESLLYGVKPTDASALTIPAAALLAAAILAALPPVLGAIRTDPARVLRTE